MSLAPSPAVHSPVRAPLGNHAASVDRALLGQRNVRERSAPLAAARRVHDTFA